MFSVDFKVMTRAALNRALLARQMLLSRHAAGVVAVVEALGGLQAQEPRPPFIGLWSRLRFLEPDAPGMEIKVTQPS